METPTCPLRSSSTVPLHSQPRQGRLIFLNVSETTSSHWGTQWKCYWIDSGGGSGRCTCICTVQKSEQYPHLRFLLLKRHVMQTTRTELFCPLREVTPLSLPFLSSLPPPRSRWPRHFLLCQSVGLLLMGPQSCCLLQSSLRAVAHLMLRQPPLCCRCCCCIPSRWPRLNPHQSTRKNTQKCTTADWENAREHTHERPQRMSERPACEQWMGEEPAFDFFFCFVSGFLAFFSLWQ